MTSVVVIILVCLATCAVLLAALTAFTHFARTHFGRLFILCMAASIGGTLLLIMFLPGQRHLTPRLRHWFDRSTSYVFVDRANRHPRQPIRTTAAARTESARLEAEARAYDADAHLDDTVAKSPSADRESAVAPPSAPVAPVPRVAVHPAAPSPARVHVEERSLFTRTTEDPSRFLTFAVSASLLAAFLFVGYLFLDSGTRGHFTWTLRITMLAAFLAASAVLMIWK